MAFHGSIYREWMKFPASPMFGVRPRPAKFWNAGVFYTGNTGQSYVGAVEKPQLDLVRQGSMMQAPTVRSMGQYSPQAQKVRMTYTPPKPLLPTRGFATRSRLRRQAQLTLLPSNELPFYDQIQVPSYISEVDTIGRVPGRGLLAVRRQRYTIMKPRPTKTWVGRDKYGMIKSRLSSSKKVEVARGSVRPTGPGWNPTYSAYSSPGRGRKIVGWYKK